MCNAREVEPERLAPDAGSEPGADPNEARADASPLPGASTQEADDADYDASVWRALPEEGDIQIAAAPAGEPQGEEPSSELTCGAGVSASELPTEPAPAEPGPEPRADPADPQDNVTLVDIVLTLVIIPLSYNTYKVLCVFVRMQVNNGLSFKHMRDSVSAVSIRPHS